MTLFNGALNCNINSEAIPMMDHSDEVDEDEAEDSEGDSKNKGLNFNEWEGEGKLCYGRNLGGWSESR